MSDERTPDGVSFTNLDEPLFAEADATKRDLVDYLASVADRIIPELRDRPLSVIRVHRGQRPFMQKNVPPYTPSWVRTVKLWAETSKRDVSTRSATIVGPCSGSPTNERSNITPR
jgi:DNA primase